MANSMLTIRLVRLAAGTVQVKILTITMTSHCEVLWQMKYWIALKTANLLKYIPAKISDHISGVCTTLCVCVCVYIRNYIHV